MTQAINTQDQNPVEAAAQQTVSVGFEKALTMMNPEWRTFFTPEQVNQFRHFYHQGVQDINLLNQLNYQNAQQNFQAVIQTVIVTGNEERIAQLQQEQLQKAADDAAEASKPVKAKKALKAVPIKKLVKSKR